MLSCVGGGDGALWGGSTYRARWARRAVGNERKTLACRRPRSANVWPPFPPNQAATVAENMQMHLFDTLMMLQWGRCSPFSSNGGSEQGQWASAAKRCVFPVPQLQLLCGVEPHSIATTSC